MYRHAQIGIGSLIKKLLFIVDKEHCASQSRWRSRLCTRIHVCSSIRGSQKLSLIFYLSPPFSRIVFPVGLLHLHRRNGIAFWKGTGKTCTRRTAPTWNSHCRDFRFVHNEKTFDKGDCDLKFVLERETGLRDWEDYSWMKNSYAFPT